MAEITISETGPYLVKGDVELKTADGQRIETDGSVFALCRCGGSATKPFCDGTHSKVGFAAAEKARDEFDRARSIEIPEPNEAGKPR